MGVERKTIRSAGVTLSVDYTVAEPEEIRRFLWAPGAPGDADLKRRATRVAELAVAGAPKRSGTLARSIRVEQAREVSGRFDSGYQVSVNVPYGIYVIKGTRPHPIVGRPLLVFDWPKAGLSPAVFRRVNHPGTQPNTWFTDSVRGAV